MHKNTPKKTRSGTVPITYQEDRDRWLLTIHHQGRRTRTFHASEVEAQAAWEKHRRRVERHGTHGDSISLAEAREYLEAKRIVGKRDLRKVAEFYKAHFPDDLEGIGVEEAWEKFLTEKQGQGLSHRHIDTLRYHVGNFASVFSKRSMRSVTPEQVRTYLLELRLDPRTVANVRGSLSNFWNWAKRRKLVEAAPTDDIHDTDLPAVRPKSKGVLTVEQVEAMLAHLGQHWPRYIPWHVLQLFAGIRRAEVERLRWDWIDLEKQTITLPGWENGERIVKTGDDWVLHDLPKNLWQWLSPHKTDGRIPAPSPERIAEWHSEDFPKLGIPEWPQNAMRHTFCTMLMSLHGDAAKVANWSRHTNTAQLYRSYVARLVSREEARSFLGIVPATSPPPQTAP